ncbi:hypothetical protein JCM10449v2_005049 [Rhodotorula kratochvilovae]
MSSDSSSSSTSTTTPPAGQGFVDSLVAAVLDSDVERVVQIVQQMAKGGLAELVNGRHSMSGVTPLVAAGVQDPSYRASLVLRLLALSGASFPRASASSDWLSQVQPWAFEALEDAARPAADDDELRALLRLDGAGVSRWLRGVLFSPASPSPLPAADVVREESPVKHVKFEDEVEVVKLPSLGFLDLTNEPDSPPPEPKTEEDAYDAATVIGGARSSSGAGEAAAQAYLSIHGLPDGFTDDDLLDLFKGLPGILAAEVHVARVGALFGLVSFTSFAAASHAHAHKDGTAIVSAEDGAASEPLRPLTFKLFGANGAVPNPFPEAPRPFHHMSSAELRRRRYVGNLRVQIGEEEILTIFCRQTGLKGKITKLKHVRDHSWAVIRFTDDKAAKIAERLHGTAYDGHLLQVQPVNEFLHEWKLSMVVEGLPAQWTYHDVCDFLISTINSFPSLSMRGVRFDKQHFRMLRTVVVELRYDTELRWVRDVLGDYIVEGVPLRVTIAPPEAALKRPRDAEAAAEDVGRKRARAHAEREGDDVRMASAPPTDAHAPAPPPSTTTGYRDGGAPLGAYTLSSSTPSLSDRGRSVSLTAGLSASPLPFSELHDAGVAKAADELFGPFGSALGLSN